MTAIPQHSPHSWVTPQHGNDHQQPFPVDTTPLLSTENIHRVQQVIGMLLYYARAVDCTMLVALGTIATQQSCSTQNTMNAIIQLLNYSSTHPNSVLRYTESDMVLYVESDASYLSNAKAQSRSGGHFFLSRKSIDPNNPPTTPPPRNGPIFTECPIMKHVLASSAESEVGTLFKNGKIAVALKTILETLGHKQLPIPIKTDNSTASGISNQTIKQSKSRSMDMRFYWIQDRVNQKHILIYWNPGTENLGDYFTKNHPPSHHQSMRTHLLAASASNLPYNV